MGDQIRLPFGDHRYQLRDLAQVFTDEPDAVVAAAEARYEALIPTMGYVDRPDHPMAAAVFSCAALLALHQALQELHGVGVHEFGAAMLDCMRADLAAIAASSSSAASDGEAGGDWLTPFLEAAAASVREPRPGEFVFEVVPGDADTDWGMDIRSCAICHQYAQHDAMELVPYMCAGDDVTSDVGGHGLRRSGTIALGSHHCDFRYKTGGVPVRVAELNPERIRVQPTSPSS